MEKIRAIYTEDVRFNECKVFELDKADNKFKMIEDKEFAYDAECIIEDEDWIVFKVVMIDDKSNKEQDSEATKISKEELKEILENK